MSVHILFRIHCLYYKAPNCPVSLKIYLMFNDHSENQWKMYPLSSNGPRQANLVLIAYASSEGSGAVSPEPSLLAHINSESRGTFRQKARSLAPLNGWACAVKICHDRMLEATNSLDGAQMISDIKVNWYCSKQKQNIEI